MKNSLIMFVDFRLNLLRTPLALKAVLKEGHSKGYEYEAYWAKGPENMTRWDIWRPVIAMAMQTDLKFDEMHLIYDSDSSFCQNKPFSELVAEDILEKSPDTIIRKHNLHISTKEASNLHIVYEKLFTLSKQPCFHDRDTKYYINCQYGSDETKTSMFLLAQSANFPGVRIKVSPKNTSAAQMQFEKQWHKDHPNHYSHEVKRGSFTPEGSYTIEDPEIFHKIVHKLSYPIESTIADTLKDHIPTKNKNYNNIIDRIAHVAERTDDPILLLGPTGAGKTKLAKLIHKIRKQITGKDIPFVEVNCATLDELADSQLYGHKKGAFTGAQSDHTGFLKEADGGVLFLDEIGTLPMKTQTKLLKAIEELKFRPVGATKDEESKFQLIASTNEDISNSKLFREDLYARISTWQFQLPGLAERRDDIPANCEFELQELSKEKSKKVGREVHYHFSAEGKRLFLDFAQAATTAWKKNFREFKAMLRRMSTFADDYCISESLVRDEIHLSEYWPAYSSKGYKEYPSIQPVVGSTDSNDNIDSVDTALCELLGEHTYEKLNGIDREQLRSIAIICQQAASLREANSNTYGKTSGALCHLLKNKYGLRFSARSKLFHLERIATVCE